MKCAAQRRLGWQRPRRLQPEQEQRQPAPGWVLAAQQPQPSCKRAEATEPLPEQRVQEPERRPAEEQAEQPASAERQPLPQPLAAELQEPLEPPLEPEEQQEQQPPQQALACKRAAVLPEQKPTHNLAVEAPLWAVWEDQPPKPCWPRRRTARSTQDCPAQGSAF